MKNGGKNTNIHHVTEDTLLIIIPSLGRGVTVDQLDHPTRPLNYAGSESPETCIWDEEPERTY